MAAIIPRQRNKFSNNNSLLAPPYVVNVPNWPRFIISTFAPRMPPLCVFHLPVSLCRPMCFDYLCDLTENVPFLSFIIHWFTFVIYFCILIKIRKKERDQRYRHKLVKNDIIFYLCNLLLESFQYIIVDFWYWNLRKKIFVINIIENSTFTKTTNQIQTDIILPQSQSRLALFPFQTSIIETKKIVLPDRKQKKKKEKERSSKEKIKNRVSSGKKESLIYGQPIYNLQVKCMNKTTWNGYRWNTSVRIWKNDRWLVKISARRVHGSRDTPRREHELPSRSISFQFHAVAPPPPPSRLAAN